VDRAVIQLQRVEIAVGQAHHFGTIHRGFDARCKNGFDPVLRVFEFDARIALPHDAHFAFGNLARRVDGQTQGEARFLDRLDDRAEIADLSGARVGKAQLIFANAQQRVPNPSPGVSITLFSENCASGAQSTAPASRAAKAARNLSSTP
jgi:hypothetical protein